MPALPLTHMRALDPRSAAGARRGVGARAPRRRGGVPVVRRRRRPPRLRLQGLPRLLHPRQAARPLRRRPRRRRRRGARARGAAAQARGEGVVGVVIDSLPPSCGGGAGGR